MNERLSLIGGKKVLSILNQNKKYKVFIRKGLAYRGATERLDDKKPHLALINLRWCTQTFEERMRKMCDYYAAFDVDIDHDNGELHINAFTTNDLY